MNPEEITNWQWEEDWQAGEWEEDKESLEWLRSRPDPIKKLLLMFPPSCLVKANRPLRCPAPDKVGIITSLLEPDEEHALGWVTVRPSPTADIKFHCKIEWLEVVGYYKGLTPERVKELLGEKHGLENGTTKD